MTLPIDLDCFTPDNRRAVVLRVQKSTPAKRTLFPVRWVQSSRQAYRVMTERFLTVLSVSSQLRGGLRLPAFSVFQWLAIPFRVVSLGRGDALPTSGMRSLGSFPFHALKQTFHNLSERLQSTISIPVLSDSHNATEGQLQWDSKIQSTEFTK